MSLRFKRIIRTSGIVFISGFIYYFSTQIGRDDLIYPGYTSPIWLASGVALGLTLLLGNCAIFGIFLASFLSSSGMDLSSGVWIDIGKNLYLSFLIGLFSALQSYIGKVVLSGRIPKYGISDRTQFVFLFIFLEAIVCIVGSMGSVASMYFLGKIEFSLIRQSWLTWWIRDTLGVYIGTPFILFWFQGYYKIPRWKEFLESTVLFLLIVFFSLASFGFITSISSFGYPLTYVLVPLILWSAFRLGERASSLAVVLSSIIAILGMVLESPQFYGESTNASNILLQFFVAVLSITSLLIASMVNERKEAENQLRISHQSLEEKVEERTRELLRSNEILREEIQEKNEARAALEKSQIRYMGLFEHLPVAIIEADYSQLKQILDSLPFDIQGDAFSDYAETHPDFVRLCFDSIQVIGVNQETVNLLRVESADAVYKNWKLFFSQDNFKVFRRVLRKIREKSYFYEVEVDFRVYDNTRLNIKIRWSVPPGFESSLSSVIVTLLDFTEIKSAERKLQLSLDEKEVMLKEIHHRVKNNLQVISSLLSMQSDYVQDKQSLSVFIESQNRLRTMSMIHEELYQSENLGKIQYSVYIEKLLNQLFQVYGKSDSVVLVTVLESLDITINRAIPIGLIINELVSNSLKYAFPEGESITRKPELRITLSKLDENLEMRIEDNGIGMPFGFDLEDSNSLGLKLVNILVRQLGGKIDFSSDSKRGTQFKIHIPLAVNLI
ncbi:MASE1 domain-containing protein [Leptospira borgpetersenii]|uniref:MASE1 domain-containing protein n=1 Tax=Leptospira borgpetersenii TaxID=174 RepID=UPI0003122864|nr:MASE1 domain-containing protein [Leptospira borgpetersenii]AMX69864.1 histidine kinase [Leptospira borgpetersenii serovar Hardjo]MBE8401660.1 MASE1 domain-containing protein [Leptospira borgpetersenii serovar Tarassovi]MBE8404652.1 MASE1 domain-containing protein [Leptospira borgpetersenii serovar Tarassovi]MBE8405606.1 MASE1 domain-containing protein [Leptospira borgpetersenii serovar Tarassovi]MBE8412202.1 MASE1 domain-containing protein [Leptospira borgpetersenii serovar Tarassovi]